jgi:DNA-binding ferritin-like protein
MTNRNVAAARLNDDVAQALDQTLSDLITLDLAVRQARTHLSAASFEGMRRLLDSLADIPREAGNRLASRSMQLGHCPKLWAETASRKSALRLVAHKPLHDDEACSAFEQILDAITRRLVVNINASDCDLVTQALMMSLADRLDNIVWRIRTPSAA